MKRLSPEKVCEQFNSCRLQNLNQFFEIEELEKILGSFGIKKQVITKLRAANLFNVRVEAHNRKLYAFTNTPVYVAQFVSLLKKEAKKHIAEKFTEQEAIDFLRKKGYRVQKPIVDWGLLKKENPDLIAKYTSWE